ncbi:Leucine-rich repeat - like 10 [Theobroma cacao]|nr:Leucine-rich repeat - like 10 [Theobroma cacao]
MLTLSNNYFQIPCSLGPFFNLSKLKYIYADNNSIYAEIEKHHLSPRFQLNEISLSCCGDGGLFPQFLYHQHDLQSVDLSNIYFKGDQFPTWLLGNNKKLDNLILINNSLSGPFRLPLASHLDLSIFDVSNNFFSGSIPTGIGAKLPSLMFMNMSMNYFNGSILSSFGDMSSLESLDLSNNQLSGGIPEHLAMGCSSLELLALSNNTLQGQLFV